LIPEITTTEENLDKILEFLSGYNRQPEVNLLPYHRIAEGKYHKYGIKYKMNGVNELTDDEIAKYKTLFEKAGFKVKIGG
jgi:pyruvate formate lyase activating enzyme